MHAIARRRGPHPQTGPGMSYRSQRKRALEDYYLLHPPLSHRIRLHSAYMIRCYECGSRALRVLSEDTWRVFHHEDGEVDDAAQSALRVGPGSDFSG